MGWEGQTRHLYPWLKIQASIGRSTDVLKSTMRCHLPSGPGFVQWSQGLCPAGANQGVILIECPDHLNWLLSIFQEQQVYSNPHPIIESKCSNPAKEPHYSQSFSFSDYPQLVTIGENRVIDWPEILLHHHRPVQRLLPCFCWPDLFVNLKLSFSITCQEDPKILKPQGSICSFLGENSGLDADFHLQCNILSSERVRCTKEIQSRWCQKNINWK